MFSLYLVRAVYFLPRCKMCVGGGERVMKLLETPSTLNKTDLGPCNFGFVKILNYQYVLYFLSIAAAYQE